MALLLGRRCAPVEWEVIDFTEHGLEFTAKDPNHYARAKNKDGKPNLTMGVLHWTGGEGGYKQVYRVLKRRELGIHFFIDYDGLIYQFADPTKVVCPHAGAVNRYSYGVEIQNRGIPLRDENTEAKLDKRAPRGRWRQHLHGRDMTTMTFSAEQVDAAIALCEAMADAGFHPRSCPSKGALIENPDRRRKYRGVLGHLHVSSRKLDPGMQIFEELLDEGWRAKEG